MGNEVDKIKEKLDIVDVISSYVNLSKSGKNFKGLCPFHQEKDPSFVVSPKREIWHCFGCFPPGQKVKTPFGYHNIETVDEDHFVYSGTGEIKDVLATHERQYKGEMIDVKVRKLGETVSMTSDHTLQVIRPTTEYRHKTKQFYSQCREYMNKEGVELSDAIEKYGDLIEVEAGNLQKLDFVLYPIRKKVNDLEEIDLKKYLTKSYTYDPQVKEIPYKQEVSDNLLKLLGYWIAEGSNHRAYIRFSLGGDEEDFAQDILNLCEDLFGLEGSIHKRSGDKSGLEVTVCHSYLADIFENLCGDSAKNKHMPFIFQELPPKKQKTLLNAIFRGDGYSCLANKSSNKQKSITSVSRVLAEQIVDILLRNNIHPSLYVEEQKVDKNGLNHHQEAYTVFWSKEANLKHTFEYNKEEKDYWMLPIKEINRREYEGPVYNLTVEDDHSYVTTGFSVNNCGKGGDLIEFVQRYEGMEFPEALRLLAKRAGIPIEDIGRKEQKRLTKLYKINDEAKRFYQKKLKKNEKALRYLIKQRGLKKETIEEFGLGFAPGGDDLVVHLLDQGFSIDNVIKAGLAYKKSSGLKKDRFSNRITFPIVNEIDRTVAFTGRKFSPESESNEDAPKYLNSPETPVYNKSKILYGLNKTKQSIVNSGSVILVEGQMDLLMLYQADFENVVAVSGTGLTQQHLKKLSRLSDRIIVSFDNDSGGIRALESALDMFSKVDLHVEVLGLGEFEDPAEAIKEDPEYFEQSLKNSKPAFRHLFEHYFKGDNSGDMVDMKNTVRHLLKKISKLQSSVDKDMWLDELSDYSGISTHALKSELDKISNNKKSKSQKSSKSKKTRKDKENRRARISKRLILLGFTDDELWSIIESNRKWFPKKYRKIIDNPDSEEGSYLELKSSYKKEDKNREEIKNELEDLLRNLKLEGLQKKQKSLRKRMRSNSNPEEKEELVNKFHSVSKKIDELKRKV